MSATLSFLESDVFNSLRALILTMVPGIEVVRAQANRVPEPAGSDFIVMTQILRTRLATNIDVYTDHYPSSPGVGAIRQATQFDVQLDVHGPASGDSVQIISTLWRDEYTTDFFDAGTIDVQALYASAPRQVPFINAEDQYENRWTIDLSMQINQVVTVPQDFADTVVVEVNPGTNTGIVSVDAVYPP